MYAIVDIETTGGFSSGNRIIEVAVVLYDGDSICDTYQTLINPQRNLPGFITGLTGINEDMLSNAPVFNDIAQRLYGMLKDKVFVAHNVNFDLNFIKEEFIKVGIAYNPSKLCTVRLSRKIFPGHRSYSLGAICGVRGIKIDGRHRAMGDAHATALLFGQLLKNDPEQNILASLKNKGAEMSLPPNISKDIYQNIPEGTGVYYFHDAKGQVIYVGKANNIKKRFKGHFVGKSKIALRTEIHDVSFELTGNEFLALLLETLEIKRLWPKYNRSLKVKSNGWGIFLYEDQNGYQRMTVSKVNGKQVPICTFSSHSEAWHFLMDQVKNHSLCPKLCGIQKAKGACFGLEGAPCNGACMGAELPESYNARIQQFLDKVRMDGSRILIKEKGRDQSEEVALLFENGILSAFGFVDREHQVEGDITNQLKAVKPVMETKHLLRSYLEKAKKDNIYLLPS
ncbi:exonuclease domain-containing protein [Pleomorphovibrio marinus]|uniref:exonuclease domain-containing protein n=1 Tax=Pleomorphovibrio marinus TaxID=2164132 RepID=UPI000E0C31D7|nr:exonuclease domain-containing protein [Pleomorphovibrio marinus]